MREFKGTEGDWSYEIDLDYDSEGNAFGMGPVVEANGEIILKGFSKNYTIEGCNFEDVRLAACAKILLEAVLRLLKDHEPLTGDPNRQELIAHWTYENEQGNGYAENALFAIRAVQKALGEKQ